MAVTIISIAAFVPSVIRTIIYVCWFCKDTHKTRRCLPVAHVIQLLFASAILWVCFFCADYPVGSKYFRIWGWLYAFDIVESIVLLGVTCKHMKENKPSSESVEEEDKDKELYINTTLNMPLNANTME